MTKPVLKSLEEALSLLGTNCRLCEKLGNKDVLKSTRREGNVAVYFCAHVHSTKYRIEFELKQSDINILIDEFRSFMRTRPNLKHLPKAMIDNYSFKFQDYQKKLHMYASFTPKSAVLNFDGYCSRCGNEVPMLIKDRKIIYNCVYCTPTLESSMRPA
jgi:hypothetical protein